MSKRILLRADLDLFLHNITQERRDAITENDLIGLQLNDQDGNKIGEVVTVDFKYRNVYFHMDEDEYFKGTAPHADISFMSIEPKE